MAADRSASDLHGGVEQVGDERQAAAATGTSLGGCLHLAHRSEVLGLDSRTDLTLGNVIAGANLCRVWQAHGPAQSCRAARLAHDQFMRFAGKSFPTLGQR